MMQKRKLVRYLLMPIGIIGILVLSIVSLSSYTPDTSVPFPYIPPPEGSEGDYIGATAVGIDAAFLAQYSAPFMPDRFKGESFILKNTRISAGALGTEKIEIYDAQGKVVSSETVSFIQVGLVRFVPQDPSDLKKLKAGDMVDIIGICAGKLEEWQYNVVFVDCRFLPMGLVPLPLPGGLAVIVGY